MPYERLESYAALPSYEPTEGSDILDIARPIEFLRKGTFVDGNGSELTVDDELMDKILEQFMTGAAGQEVPIDIDHRREEAAGWITELYRDATTLYAVPKWNDVGRRLVSDGIYRYVSASIHRVEKFLHSISLTNFPAVKGLAPLALAENFYFAESSGQASGLNGTGIWLLLGGPMNDHDVNENAEPVEEIEDVDTETTPEPETEPDETTPIVDLSASEEDVTEEPQEDSPAADDTVVQAVRDQLMAEFADIRQNLAKEIVDLQMQLREELQDNILAELKEQAELSEFSARVTSTGPNAIPAKPGELSDMLKRLPGDTRKTVTTLLEHIHKHGTVDLSDEIGTSAPGERPHTSLDANTKRMLRQWVEAGDSVTEFFKLNPELGDKSGYDLSEFSG